MLIDALMLSIRPAMFGLVIVLYASSSFAGTSSEPAPSEKETPPKTEAPSAEKLDDIVFVPHDFGAPEVTDPGAVRGNAGATVQLFVPSSLARALSATPTFYWRADGMIKSLHFTLTEDMAIDPLLEVTLNPAKESGGYSLALSAHDVALHEPGLYRWSITAAPMDDRATTEVVAQTLFLFEGKAVPAPPQNSPLALADFLAAKGYWYDLFDLVSRQIETADADRDRWQTARASLMAQYGLRLSPN